MKKVTWLVKVIKKYKVGDNLEQIELDKPVIMLRMYISCANPQSINLYIRQNYEDIYIDGDHIDAKKVGFTRFWHGFIFRPFVSLKEKNPRSGLRVHRPRGKKIPRP